jgi:hypothetical protein
MDHSFESAFPGFQDTRPWRTAAIWSALVAAIELLVILVVATIWLAKPLFAGHAAAAPRSALILPHPVRTRAGLIRLSRAQTAVTVLNGGGRAGEAASTADTLQARGYTISTVGNAPQSVPSSVVMFRKGYRPEAVRLAHDLHVARVAAMKGIAPAQLFGAQLALVLGSS